MNLFLFVYKRVFCLDEDGGGTTMTTTEQSLDSGFLSVLKGLVELSGLGFSDIVALGLGVLPESMYQSSVGGPGF